MVQLRTALRSLLRQPSFLATAVGALALGIAAPTALFAVVQATLLRPLPYVERRRHLHRAHDDDRRTIHDRPGRVGRAGRAAARDGPGDPFGARQSLRRQPEWRQAAKRARSSPSASPKDSSTCSACRWLHGRAFTAEDHKSTTVRSAVLSSQAWRAFFSADSTIVGKTIRLASGGPVVIVGVAPDAFDAPHDTDLWVASQWGENIGHMFDAYVRLRPGMTPPMVQASLGPMWDGARHEVSRPGEEPHLRLSPAVVVDRRRPRTDRADRVRGHGVAVAPGDGQRREPAAGARCRSRPRARRARGDRRQSLAPDPTAAGRIDGDRDGGGGDRHPARLCRDSRDCRHRRRRASTRRRFALRSDRRALRRRCDDDCGNRRRLAAGSDHRGCAAHERRQRRRPWRNAQRPHAPAPRRAGGVRSHARHRPGRRRGPVCC